MHSIRKNIYPGPPTQVDQSVFKTFDSIKLLFSTIFICLFDVKSIPNIPQVFIRVFICVMYKFGSGNFPFF